MMKQFIKVFHLRVGDSTLILQNHFICILCNDILVVKFKKIRYMYEMKASPIEK